MLKHRCPVIIAFLLPVICFSQSQKGSFFKNSSIGSRSYYGSYLITKSKAEYIKDSYASFSEIYFQQQTKGDKDWQVSHQYPQWGISFLRGNPGSRQYIGNLTAVYAYLNLPLISKPRYTGSFMLGGGPGFISKPFNIYTNPKNTLIGTRLNAYINMVLQNEIKITGHLYLQAGLNFMHLSNGGTTLPNLGLNTPGVFAGIRYAFAQPIREEKILKDSFTRRTDFKVFTSVGFKQAPWIGGNYYTINVLQAEATLRASRNYSYGLGTILFYNRSLDFFPLENPSYEKRDRKKFQAGVFGSYEHFFGKLSVPLQLGVYVYNKAKSPFLFQQFGLRYGLSKHISAELLLKLHTGQADFIHTGIGYNF